MATNRSPWLTSDEVADRIRRPAQFVRRVADVHELHGHQRRGPDGIPVRKSPWVFHIDAVDTYVRNGDLATQREACGCARATTEVAAR